LLHRDVLPIIHFIWHLCLGSLVSYSAGLLSIPLNFRIHRVLHSQIWF
jgi:hypothetical protein